MAHWGFEKVLLSARSSTSAIVITLAKPPYVIVYATWAISMGCFLFPVCDEETHYTSALFYPSNAHAPNPIVEYRKAHLEETRLWERFMLLS